MVAVDRYHVSSLTGAYFLPFLTKRSCFILNNFGPSGISFGCHPAKDK
jgi:hypothetical protein